METRTISNRQSNRDRLLSGKGKTRKLYSKCCCARTPASRARISKQTILLFLAFLSSRSSPSSPIFRLFNKTVTVITQLKRWKGETLEENTQRQLRITNGSSWTKASDLDPYATPGEKKKWTKRFQSVDNFPPSKDETRDCGKQAAKTTKTTEKKLQ